MVSVVLALFECRFFFFQAEDGIRDGTVTGVQTCALPISGVPLGAPMPAQALVSNPGTVSPIVGTSGRPSQRAFELTPSGRSRPALMCSMRSEERRVGKECGARGPSDHYRKTRGYKESASQ